MLNSIYSTHSGATEMNDFTPDKVKNLLEMAINNSSAAWAAQDSPSAGVGR